METKFSSIWKNTQTKKASQKGSSFVCDPDKITFTSFGAFASKMLRSNQVLIHMEKYSNKKSLPKGKLFCL
jgi:hypothetical protein